MYLLTNTRINLKASVSRITDSDYAEETAELAKAQIINRASIAMLAQAQMRHEDVLTLIRGVVNQRLRSCFKPPEITDPLWLYR